MRRRFYTNWNMFALTRGRELKFNALQCVGNAIKITDGGVCVDAVRMARIVDPHTGDIVLRGAGASRLSQAMAAGLIADTLKSDVEAVSRENSGLKAALGAARLDARMEARRASELRREKLNGYLREDAVRESRATLREIAWGFAALGTAVGMSVMTVVAAMMM